MTNSAHESIKRVIDAFERSDWTEIDVRHGDIRIHLVAGDGDASLAPTAPSRTTREGHAAASHTDAIDEVPLAIPHGVHVVSAPSPGIFWRAPGPGAAPFVEVGDLVSAETTLCIIEVMKLMNHLKAGAAGRVVGVYGSNGVAVAKDDALFAIAPEGSAA